MGGGSFRGQLHLILHQETLLIVILLKTMLMRGVMCMIFLPKLVRQMYHGYGAQILAVMVLFHFHNYTLVTHMKIGYVWMVTIKIQIRGKLLLKFTQGLLIMVIIIAMLRLRQ